jgi:hypothetical protein
LWRSAGEAAAWKYDADVDLGGVYLALVEVGYGLLGGGGCREEYIGGPAVDIDCEGCVRGALDFEQGIGGH